MRDAGRVKVRQTDQRDAVGREAEYIGRGESVRPLRARGKPVHGAEVRQHDCVGCVQEGPSTDAKDWMFALPSRKEIWLRKNRKIVLSRISIRLLDRSDGFDILALVAHRFAVRQNKKNNNKLERS